MNKNLFKIALVLTTSLLFVVVAFLVLSGAFSDVLDDATEMIIFIFSNFCAVSILSYGLSGIDE